MMRRPVFVTWSVRHARSRDLAVALGADAVFIGIRRKRRRWLTPLRWFSSFVQTTALFVRRRPSAIIVIVPPLPLTLLALAYGRATRTPVVLDAHTGAALSMRTGRPRLSLRVLGRWATCVVVTNAQLAEPLRDHGVRTAILHDPIETQAEGSASDEFVVVAPLSWAADEPIDQIRTAATRCPDIRFLLTGRAPAHAAFPANVALTGFIDDEAFASLISDAGVVLALTTRDATMQQAGYEAMAHGRPVIVSDTRVLREFFGEAGLYAANGEQLADAVRAAAGRQSELVAAMVRRRDDVQAEFARDVAALSDAITPRH